MIYYISTGFRSSLLLWVAVRWMESLLRGLCLGFVDTFYTLACRLFPILGSSIDQTRSPVCLLQIQSLNGNSDHPDLVTSDIHLWANVERLGRIPLFELILPKNRLKEDRMGKITGVTLKMGSRISQNSFVANTVSVYTRTMHITRCKVQYK